MRKVSCVCCYEKTTLYSLTAITRKGEHITLYHFGASGKKWFPTFRDMYKYILDLCKANGFIMNHYTEFNAEWYDILFYQYSAPQAHHKYGIAYKDVEKVLKGGEFNG